MVKGVPLEQGEGLRETMTSRAPVCPSSAQYVGVWHEESLPESSAT